MRDMEGFLKQPLPPQPPQKKIVFWCLNAHYTLKWKRKKTKWHQERASKELGRALIPAQPSPWEISPGSLPDFPLAKRWNCGPSLFLSAKGSSLGECNGDFMRGPAALKGKDSCLAWIKHLMLSLSETLGSIPALGKESHFKPFFAWDLNFLYSFIFYSGSGVKRILLNQIWGMKQIKETLYRSLY